MFSYIDLDFVENTTRITFGPGDAVNTTRCVMVRIMNDQLVEADEYFVAAVVTDTDMPIQVVGRWNATIIIPEDPSDREYKTEVQKEVVNCTVAAVKLQ